MKAADIAPDSGVRKVHDHLCWVKPMSGMHLNSQEGTLMLLAG
jgi:hypothetical protein